jgi:hypothetical protein
MRRASKAGWPVLPFPLVAPVTPVLTAEDIAWGLSLANGDKKP